MGLLREAPKHKKKEKTCGCVAKASKPCKLKAWKRFRSACQSLKVLGHEQTNKKNFMTKKFTNPQ